MREKKLVYEQTPEERPFEPTKEGAPTWVRRPVGPHKQALGDIFAGYANGEKTDCAYLGKSDNVVVFAGKGRPIAESAWIVIPRILHGPREQYRHLESVADLTPEHIPLLETMKRDADAIKADLGGEPFKFYGFHTRPSVAYLHMHAIGTPMGRGLDGHAQSMWVSLEAVLQYLRGQQSPRMAQCRIAVL